MNTGRENRHYLVIVPPEPCTEGKPARLAEHPDLPGCLAHGDSPAEAVGNLAEAREPRLPTAHCRPPHKRGVAPPAPGSSKIAQAIMSAG